MSEIVTIKNVSKNVTVAYFGEPVGWREEVDAGATIDVIGAAAKYLTLKHPDVWEIVSSKATGKAKKADKDEE